MRKNPIEWDICDRFVTVVITATAITALTTVLFAAHSITNSVDLIYAHRFGQAHWISLGMFVSPPSIAISFLLSFHRFLCNSTLFPHFTFSDASPYGLIHQNADCKRDVDRHQDDDTHAN